MNCSCICLVRLVARTQPFQGWKRGSKPLRDTNNCRCAWMQGHARSPGRFDSSVTVVVQIHDRQPNLTCLCIGSQVSRGTSSDRT